MTNLAKDELPLHFVQFFARRTRGFIRHLTYFPETSLQTLVSSAYKQGLEDAFKVMEKNYRQQYPGCTGA